MKCAECNQELSNVTTKNRVTKYCGNRDCTQYAQQVGDKFDPVNKPAHYNQGKYEVIDIIEDNLKDEFPAYLVGNILKYVMRYKHKNGLQDLQKAQWYLDRLIKTKKPL